MEGMLTTNGSAYRLYNHFRRDLKNADSVTHIVQVFSCLLPALKAKAAAALVQSGSDTRRDMTVAAHIGQPALWVEFLTLCRTNKEPLWRVLRLSPHPVALSDIRRHAGLRRRSGGMMQLLAAHDMNDAFAIPLFDQHLSFSAIVIAGRNMALRPTHRYLITQAAADLMNRIASVSPSSVAQPQPPHHKLTPRQMEIATWLIAGKTDWEIGEILQISPKTVNFHVENIKRAYGVRSRNQFVAAIAYDGGLPRLISNKL